MKKLIKDMNVVRKYFRVRQDVGDENTINIYNIKYSLQTSIENNKYSKKSKERIFWLNRD